MLWNYKNCLLRVWHAKNWLCKAHLVFKFISIPLQQFSKNMKILSHRYFSTFENGQHIFSESGYLLNAKLIFSVSIHQVEQENTLTLTLKALICTEEPLVHKCPPVKTRHFEKRYRLHFSLQNQQTLSDLYVLYHFIIRWAKATKQMHHEASLSSFLMKFVILGPATGGQQDEKKRPGMTEKA